VQSAMNDCFEPKLLCVSQNELHSRHKPDGGGLQADICADYCILIVEMTTEL